MSYFSCTNIQTRGFSGFEATEWLQCDGWFFTLMTQLDVSATPTQSTNINIVNKGYFCMLIVRYIYASCFCPFPMNETTLTKFACDRLSIFLARKDFEPIWYLCCLLYVWREIASVKFHWIQRNVCSLAKCDALGNESVVHFSRHILYAGDATVWS